jgi:hypothetical protein
MIRDRFLAMFAVEIGTVVLLGDTRLAMHPGVNFVPQTK